MSKLSIKDQTLNISGKIVIANITKLLKDFDQNFAKENIKKLNLQEVEEIDGAGVSLLETILDRCKLTTDSLENGNKSIMKTIEIF